MSILCTPAFLDLTHQRHYRRILQYITLCPLAPSPFCLCHFTVLSFLLAYYGMAHRKGSFNYKNKVLITDGKLWQSLVESHQGGNLAKYK